MRQYTYFEAYLDDYDKVTIYMKLDNYNGISHLFYIEDENHHQIPLTIQDDIRLVTHHKYECTVSEPIKLGKRYYVYHEYGRYCDLVIAQIVKTAAFDLQYFYDGKDLGSNYTKECTTFKLWAPTAYDVWLTLYSKQGTKRYQMKRDEKGVYGLSIEENLYKVAYTYQVSVNGKIEEIIDPYGKASTPNSLQSVVVDLSEVYVEEYSLACMQSPCDAIVYEVCIRDYTSKGTIEAFIEDSIFTYIKELGITHVQFLPLLDFKSMDDLEPSKYYNWGYDAYQWMAFENSYTKDVKDPMAILHAVANLVNACHQNSIKVNLDVVFNHVYDLKQSAMEKCVPFYYFQNNAEGMYSNATMCGNDVDSTRRMCRKLIVDSCEYLVKQFHIDGLRFDLMGILDVDTLNEIVAVCTSYRKDFMVYGEGWNMPSFLAESKRACMYNNIQMPKVAHFSDRFRDTMKGSTDASHVHDLGYMLSNTSHIYKAMNVIGGSTQEIGNSKLFQEPTQVVNYVECHDNMTSWDKIDYGMRCDKQVKKKHHRLLLAAVILSQGIPFIHGGQEFARSKKGKPNTYNDNEWVINKISRNAMSKNAEMIEFTKSLIALRKRYSCLRMNKAEDIYKGVYYGCVHEAILEYRVQDERDALIILYNPTYTMYNYVLPSGYEMIFYDHVLEESEPVASIDIHGVTLVILKKTQS